MPIQLSGSLVITGSITTTGGITISGSILSASYSDTASFSNNFRVLGDLTASTAVITGTLTAQTLVVQTVTSSIVYSSGSNLFGSALTDRQTFTGSIYQTGSIAAFAGSVGIGTTNPTYDLTLSKSVAAGNVILNLENTSTTGAARFYFGNNASSTGARIQYFGATHAVRPNLFSIGTDAANDMMFETGGTERMRISGSNGYVGIGTTNPTYTLDVNGTGRFNGNFTVFSSATGATTGDLLVDTSAKYVYVGRLSGTSGDNTTFQIRDRTGAARATIPGGGSIDTVFSTNSSNFIVTNYSATALMTIANSGATIFSSTVQGNGGVYSGTGASAATMGGKAAAASGLTDKDLTISAWYPTSGTNEYGGDLYLAAGRPTGGGSGKYGTVYIQAGIANATANVAGSVGTVIAANNTLLQFFTAASVGASPTEKVRIDSSGNVGIDTDGTTAKLGIGRTANTESNIFLTRNTTTADVNVGCIRSALGPYWYDATSTSLAEINLQTDTTAYYKGAIMFSTNNSDATANRAALRMYINAAGSIGTTKNGTNIYNASDVRLKENIVTIENGLDKILQLNPVKFNWIDGFAEDGKDMLGFIAQEVQSIIPEVVEDFGGEDNIVEIGDLKVTNPLRINEKFIIPVLVKAIQELSAKVTALETK